MSPPILAVLEGLGYEAPTPIQVQTIPALLGGRDVIGQAQTGTGKTAAFAIPILERLDLRRAEPQALVLTPTRELAIQVAEAFHTYGKGLGDVRVLPIYGGQPMSQQLRRLHAGVHVVVGTPGRVMDHLRRGTLAFGALRFVVLDEADEMLRMGFIDDVEWILSQIPGPRQTALFSATIPREIRRIAERHLTDPVTLEIERRTVTVPSVEQRYVQVAERHKVDALTAILEMESPEAALVFVRTKVTAADLVERLRARGYAAEPMHGDMTQAQREAVIRGLRQGSVELVAATDVAARGLDVERISHVINYDAPYDAESYVHRVGRTGRAGRPGKTVLFVTPRQQRLMREIERFTGQRIEPMKLPTAADVAARRVEVFKQSMRKTIAEGELDLYLGLVEELAAEGFDMAEVAAAAVRLARGDKPLDTSLTPEPSAPVAADGDGMVRLYIDAGRASGVRPADIVGAIANEAGVPGQAIGAIDLYDRFAFVEVPAQYRDIVLEAMGRTTLRNRPVRVKLAMPAGEEAGAPAGRPARGETRGRKKPARAAEGGRPKPREPGARPAPGTRPESTARPAWAERRAGAWRPGPRKRRAD